LIALAWLESELQQDPTKEAIYLRMLRDQVGELRRRVAAEGRRIFQRWRPHIRRPSFAASALNLAHYRALRHSDIRGLQRSLMRYGLSSLGRLESRVLPTLDAVAAALAGMVGGEGTLPRHFPSERQFFRGETALHANAKDLFGPTLNGSETRILVTLSSEAAETPAHVLDLARRGMDAVRINCAHDDDLAWEAMIKHVREAERAVGRRIRILMDIAGPKCRTGRVWTAPERKTLFSGDRLLLCRSEYPEDSRQRFRATCTMPEVIDKLSVGARVHVDDGQLAGHVEAIDAAGAVLLIDRTKLGGAKLKPQKGLNFPDTDLGVRPLTAKDVIDLQFVSRHADMVAYSFVETAAHIKFLQEELSKHRPDWHRMGLVAKIETPRAVRNLPDLMVQAAGQQPFAVMIARGDLAIELGFERMAEMQEELLWLCEAAHVPVIWATQVLESLIKTGMPSRGDMTDAAMAGRAECVMLNKGPYVGEAISALEGLLGRMAEHQSKKTPRLRALGSW
jgi:pyruvate kinase